MAPFDWDDIYCETCGTELTDDEIRNGYSVCDDCWEEEE